MAKCILGCVLTITAVRGDIAEQEADAIVNSANTAMRGGGGADGAIHRAGGPAILRDCVKRFPDGLATGDASWTTAGDLRAQWVVHTVGPNYNSGQRDRSLLESCYRRALEIADELGARITRVASDFERRMGPEEMPNRRCSYRSRCPAVKKR